MATHMMKSNCDASEEKSGGKLSINFLSRERKKHVGWFIVKMRLWGCTYCG